MRGDEPVGSSARISEIPGRREAHRAWIFDN